MIEACIISKIMCSSIAPDICSAISIMNDKCLDAAHASKHGILRFGTTARKKISDNNQRIVKFVKNDALDTGGILRFIKKNWVHLLAYAIAWGVIVTGVGLMYGFKATALPLTIGLGCGFALGTALGIGTVCLFNPKNDHEPNTAWGFLNKWFNSLDANGTRAIFVSVGVTVILAATVVFPYALGGAMGCILGNVVATKIFFNIKKTCGYQVEGNLDLGSATKTPQMLAEEQKKLADDQQDIQKKVNFMQDTINSLHRRLQELEEKKAP